MKHAKSQVAGWEYWALAAATLFAGFLRFRLLAKEGVWLDEAFSVWMARLSPGELFHWIARIDQHPPLYYLLLHAWMTLGEDETAIRSLSALLGTAAIPVIYWTARTLFSSPIAALAAAVLLAVSPFHVHYSQEARMYALLNLGVSVALLAVARILSGDQRRRWWAVYVASTWLTLLTHNTALFFLIAINIGMGFAAWLQRRSADDAIQMPSLRAWLAAQGAILLLWLPWAPFFLRQARAVDKEFWIPAPTFAAVMDTLKSFVSAFLPNSMEWAFLCSVIALAIGIVALRKRLAVLALLITLFLTPFVLELVVSLRRPIFYDRTLIWTILPLILLAAASLTPAEEPNATRWAPGLSMAGAGVLLALIVANLFSLRWYYESYRKEEWREAANWVAGRVRDDDLLLFNATWVQIPFDYYFARHDRQVAEHGVPVDLFGAGILEPKMTTADLPRLAEVTQDFDCVYLIYSHDWYTDPDRLIPDALGDEMRIMRVQHFVGLDIHQYTRRGVPGCTAPD